MRYFELAPSQLLTAVDARMDVNYWNSNHTKPDPQLLSFQDVFRILEIERPSFNDLVAKGTIPYCEIGSLNSSGEMTPALLSVDDIDNDEHEDAKKYEKIFGKDRNKVADIMYAQSGDILIAKTRPALNKIFLVSCNEYADYTAYFYTTAFIRVHTIIPEISSVLAYYLLKNVLTEQLISCSRIGKSGYPALSPSDLSSIRIPYTREQLVSSQLNQEIERLYFNKIEVDYKAKQQKREAEEQIASLVSAIA